MADEEEFQGISNDRRIAYGQADIDRWNRGLELRDRLDAQADEIAYAMETAGKDFRRHSLQVFSQVTRGDFGSHDDSPLAKNAAAVRESYRVEDMSQNGLAEFSNDLMSARTEQKRVLDTLNVRIEELTSPLKADQRLGLLAVPDSELSMSESAPAKPAQESEIHKEIRARLESVGSQRSMLSAIMSKMDKGEALTGDDVALLGKSENLQPLTDRYAKGEHGPADREALGKYDALLQTQQRDLGVMLKDEEKHAAAQSAYTQAIGADEQYAKAARRTMALENDYQNTMLAAIAEPDATIRNRKTHALRIAPEKAVFEAKMHGLQEQAERVAAARMENDYGNLTMESWQKSGYARGKDISDEIIVKNEQGNVAGFNLPKDAEVVTKIDEKGKLQLTIRAANWADRKERAGNDPDFQAVTFTGLSKHDVESLRFNAEAYGTNRFVFEGPKPKNLKLAMNVSVGEGVDVRSNRDISVRNINDGAVYAPQASAYSADPNWKPATKEEVAAKEAQAKAERAQHRNEYRTTHDQHDGAHGGRKQQSSPRVKHPTKMADAGDGHGEHPFAGIPGVREAGGELLKAAGPRVAHADQSRATGAGAYSPSHSAGKGPSQDGPAVT